ncbi:MAG: hypothetical protein J6N53_07715 [Lachnospiraceae bacterium]|nr:hypothetical protein [Lachnospiraceae bacterium]
MKRLEAEKKVLKKCAKKWLAMLMASLAFSVSAPAGFSVYAEVEQEAGEADTEDIDDTVDINDTEDNNDTKENNDIEESNDTEDNNDIEESNDTEDNNDSEDSNDTEERSESVPEEKETDPAAEEDSPEMTEGADPAEENGEEEDESEQELEDELEDKFEDIFEETDLFEEENPFVKELSVEEEEDTGCEEEADGEDIYDGIVIDGRFEDWNSVSKTDAGGSDAYQDFLEACAVIQEGDYIYVYIRDTGIGAAAWSGPHGNGQFSLVTDLGYSVLFQLHSTDNGAHVSISGVNGAECAYSTKGWGYSGEWEISIPVSELPYSRGIFAFGYYQADPFIGEVADNREKDGVTGNTTGEGNNGQQSDELIVLDGLYGDWNSYPHSLIHYATSGTWDKYVDGEGALYSDGGNLYGHVVTRMGAHLTEHGEEMQYGVVLRINQDNNLWFEFRLIDVDANGNINWNVNVSDQENGTHEYYIVDTRGWSSAATLEEIDEGNHIYGRIRIAKSDISDEAEWKLDLGLIAEKFGLEETDLQVLEVRYERIGDKWLQTAGASTGPAAGILLSMAAAGSAIVLQRRKNTIGKVR